MSSEAGELPGRMSYVALGAGPALVVFPGLSRMSAGSSVEAQKKAAGRLQALARVTGRRVYAVQRPAGLTRGTSMAELAAAHATALGALFPASVDVMGVSTGGAIALQMAVDHPLVPRRLVIAGMASWLGEEGRQKLRRYGELIAQGKSGARVLAIVLAGPVLRWPMAALLWLGERGERRFDPADIWPRSTRSVATT